MLDIRDVYGDVKQHFVDPISLSNLITFRRRELNGECADEEAPQVDVSPVSAVNVGENTHLLGTEPVSELAVSGVKT